MDRGSERMPLSGARRAEVNAIVEKAGATLPSKIGKAA
ncbi:hypothetical protein GGE46_003342 [Rhizobium etli]|uniref:Uncharacterized protein n=1 Tax=Rhizobium etli TaxID=29449 RepID=A0A7W6ZHS0_RHIET|nr:hypothetical protein [Rhizobium etli]MBB4536350.1 hypothetical protein [Rhizobium etli]